MATFHARNLKGISRTVIAVVILVVIIAAVAGYLVVTQQRAPAAVPTTPAQKFKIAIVSDIGGRGDLSFNDMAFKGGDDAKRDFGVGVVELVSKTEQDYIPNLRTAAQDPDVKLIVGVGFLLTEALVTVALEFPNKFFAGIDTSSQEIVKEKYKDKYPLPNLLDIRFEEHKGSALVGALAC
ncbi:MAG: BMP family ABC transporter substrate-binding protein, partial [Sulfolobales archaeon]